jgi:hypothetical protein
MLRHPSTSSSKYATSASFRGIPQEQIPLRLIIRLPQLHLIQQLKADHAPLFYSSKPPGGNYFCQENFLSRSLSENSLTPDQITGKRNDHDKKGLQKTDTTRRRQDKSDRPPISPAFLSFSRSSSRDQKLHDAYLSTFATIGSTRLTLRYKLNRKFPYIRSISFLMRS